MRRRPPRPQGSGFDHNRLTMQQKLWATYCSTYEITLWGIGYGMTPEAIRAQAHFVERESRIVAGLEARSPHESEAYTTVVRRAESDALEGRPPNCGPFGFGSD